MESMAKHVSSVHSQQRLEKVFVTLKRLAARMAEP